jgi:hypothetical protein
MTGTVTGIGTGTETETESAMSEKNDTRNGTKTDIELVSRTIF